MFLLESVLHIWRMLRCVKCGGLIGEWTDKITPKKRSYSKKEQELLK